MGKLKTSRILAQLLWKPKPEDVVLFRHLSKKRFGKVADTNLRGEVLIKGSGWHSIRNLTFVPRASDYDTLLESLPIFNELLKTSKHHYKAFILGEKLSFTYQGTSQDVLTHLLDLRTLHPRVNDAINNLFKGPRPGPVKLQIAPQ